MPLLQDNEFVDYTVNEKDCYKFAVAGKGTFYHDTQSKDWKPLPAFSKDNMAGVGAGSYFVYLPVPSEVSNAVRQKLGKNQNIQFVSTSAEANLLLYCTYSREKKGFVFTCSDEEMDPQYPAGWHKPEKLYAFANTLPLTTTKWQAW